MKLWIATDTEPPDTFWFEDCPVWKDSYGGYYEPAGRWYEISTLKPFMGSIGQFPPPGECWEFDVEFRRVK